MKKVLGALCCAAVLLCCANEGFAFTSIAAIHGENSTVYRSSDRPTQDDADVGALLGCKVSARRAGLVRIEDQCTVVTRGIGPGYGAAICGDRTCVWRLGYESKNDAIDAAYKDCTAQNASCQRAHMQVWADYSGYPGAVRPQVHTQGTPTEDDIYLQRFCAKQNVPPPQCVP